MHEMCYDKEDMNVELNFEKRHRFVREVIETAVLTILMFLVINLAIQNFNIQGTSMEPHLHNLERLMVDKGSYVLHTPARGDVIVFVAPPQPDQDYVKRIIAIPGDVISVDNGRPTVNGVTLNEPYVDPQRMGASPTDRPVQDLVVPPDEYFVMGDNRRGSYDSRSWGFMPRKNIIGRATLVYWPLGMDNNGFLPDVSAVFAAVEQRATARNSTDAEERQH